MVKAQSRDVQCRIQTSAGEPAAYKGMTGSQVPKSLGNFFSAPHTVAFGGGLHHVIGLGTRTSGPHLSACSRYKLPLAAAAPTSPLGEPHGKVRGGYVKCRRACTLFALLGGGR